MCDLKDAVVLVIDDCEDNLLLMELILVQDGYSVEKASCGKEGIEKIHQLVPDLIILDMMMPDMTGLEVIEHIRPHCHLSHIPIIICTANKHINRDDLKIKNICYKPVDINSILMQVNSLIACCDQIKSPTVIVDVYHNGSPHFEHQQLLSNFYDEILTRETLQRKGYEIIQK